MPRNAALSGTDAFTKDCKGITPFLEQFFHQLDHSSGTSEVVSSKDLNIEYVRFVNSMTSVQSLQSSARSFRRFSINFRSLARRYQVEYVSTGRRGYKLKIPRVQRVGGNCENTLENIVEEHLRKPPFSPPIDRKFISKKKGFGAFASKDFSTNFLICQYHGQVIDKVEAHLREEEYRSQNKLPTMFELPGNTFLDGYRDTNGTPIDIAQNPGAWLNHSKVSPNCYLKQFKIHGEFRLFIFSIDKIAQGTELLYDYNDRRKGLESWLYT